jgi:hypothetical protein
MVSCPHLYLIQLIHDQNTLHILATCLYNNPYNCGEFSFNLSLLVTPAVNSTSNSHGYGAWNLGDRPMQKAKGLVAMGI